ncbi:efflux RND transporter periplasmic adaptor subunit [Rhodanobacter sp. AS-Z3]|uniref:efflux RND transporter periplasmic adaptor subunit n=1 Tax=Rhodanobacter sp. AS-Z3 TaxID=3031330 RepID=UPI00247A78E8|nr:efflux RND transporter periplasmic adaptor subunit [Rhodanobacter sp. AS-Z3]WEN14499.1 efflux RND transporter periplasmic adaptor subunit [Rhodanobacter sp. AS-Z3]
MKRLPIQRRSLTLLAVLLPIALLFVYVILRSGPLAPVAVTVTGVVTRPVSPALFGIGTVKARYTYRIGPTFAGRIKQVDVQVGQRIKAGQALGEMDPVDLDARIGAQQATIRRAAAQLREADARQRYAQTQLHRYEQLLPAHAISEEVVATKRQEFQIADAARNGAREDLTRAQADQAGLLAQRGNLRLVAPVDGLVTLRDADPGTTVVAGQAVVELVDPHSIWINVRFDQLGAQGLAAQLPASVVLRSRSQTSLPAHVMRVEPMADAVTEETLAKVTFDTLPQPLPPLGELAEVTVTLPAQPAAPVVPNAAIQHLNNALGVWQLKDGGLHFTPVELGAADLDGNVQISKGLKAGDRVVVYSEKALNSHSRIHVVQHLVGTSQ